MNPYYNKTLFWSCATLSLLLVLFCAAGCSNKQQINLQQLVLTDLNGKPVNMQTLLEQNKPIFLNFWATWCPPCVKEKSTIEKARQALLEKGIDYQFVMISDEQLETIKNYKNHHSYNFNYLHSTRTIKLYGVFTIPQTYIINPKGEIIHTHTNFNNWDSPESLDLLTFWATQ